MVLTDKGKKIAIFQAIFFTIVILERYDIFFYVTYFSILHLAPGR